MLTSLLVMPLTDVFTQTWHLFCSTSSSPAVETLMRPQSRHCKPKELAEALSTEWWEAPQSKMEHDEHFSLLEVETEALKCGQSELGKLGGAEVWLFVWKCKDNFTCHVHALCSPTSLLHTMFTFPITFWVVGCSTATHNHHFPGLPLHPQSSPPLPNSHQYCSYLRTPPQPPARCWCHWQPIQQKFLGYHDNHWCNYDYHLVCCSFHPCLQGMHIHTLECQESHNSLHHVPKFQR